MQRTKSKILSILLSLVMLLSLLPTTAFAATYNDVKVNGVSLGDGKYLASNSATDSNYSNTEPSSYVAWYKDGTLTLNGYKGTGIVLQGAPAADLIIKLIGDNTITTTTNEVGIQGNRAAGSITITADSGSNGNLTIDMTHSTRPVFGINGYANSVTITGSADVKITAVATATDQESFGIKSSKAVSILDSASVGITCKTPNSTSRSDTCNGIYSDTGVTINTDGKITIDVSDAGDEAYSYGIRSMSALTLKKVGGMTVKWKKSVAGRGIPLSPSSASFDSDAYVTHVDETNCIATYMPKVAAPAITTGNAKVTAPVAGQTPSFTATSDEPEKYSVELLKWIDVENSQEITPVDLNDPASGYYNYTFKGGKEYTAVVRFTAVGDNTLSLDNSFTINGETTYWTGNGLKRCHTFTATGGVSVATYDLTTSVNGGHGTISAGENGITEGTSKIITFTPDSGYEIDKVMVNGTETTVTGNTLTVTMDGNKNVVVTYKAIEYTITVTGGKATIGAGSEISKAAEGTAVTLTAKAAPSGKVFDKWEVVSGGITLADANSATTTFTMPASAVSVKATYKTTPVTTYDLTTQVNGGHGTISASKTGLTAGSTETITFNPDAGYKIDTVTVNGTATSVSGNTLNVTMNENKTVVVTYKAIEYNITVTDGKATIGAGSEISKAAQGTIVTLTANAAPSGKVFDKWKVVSGGITLADANSATTTFTMPASNVTVTATYTKYSGGGGGGGSYTPSYTVSVDKTENGTITVSPKSASKGDTVTITVKPDNGYELDTLKVLDKNGDKVKLTEKNGKYTFTMPTGKVTVKGSFVEEAPVQIFKDVPVDAYYYEAVKWAAEKGITGGVGNGLFAPNQPCTRAQIVTFLWRAAGSPAPKHMSSFADVPADAFYAKAVAWAVENGITGGTGDGKFSPDATCTRAQSVTFLYRAAGSPKVSSSAEFGDVATNAYYADAVAWAAKNGITGGIGGGLFGSDNNCTRGQIVTFLYRAMK